MRARRVRGVAQGVEVEVVAEHVLNDSELEAAAQAALTCDVFVPPTITAKVRGGQVTLEGEVIWTIQRRMAAGAVCKNQSEKVARPSGGNRVVLKRYIALARSAPAQTGEPAPAPAAGSR